MPKNTAAFVWLNGALSPEASARIDPRDRGLTLGDGLFETLRVAGGTPLHAELHLARLRDGAARLGIELPFDDAEILTAFLKTLEANEFVDEAVLRLTLTRGAGPRGITPPANIIPTLLITASAFTTVPPLVTAIICRGTRRNEFSPLARIKSLNYLDNILARREAVIRGAEDAILLNTQGNIAEATASNLFLLRDGRWLTPRVQDGALPGIFRARALASNTVREVSLTESDLRVAQSICLGNVLGLRTVSTLDGAAVESRPEAIAALYAVFAQNKALIVNPERS